MWGSRPKARHAACRKRVFGTNEDSTWVRSLVLFRPLRREDARSISSITLVASPRETRQTRFLKARPREPRHPRSVLGPDALALRSTTGAGSPLGSTMTPELSSSGPLAEVETGGGGPKAEGVIPYSPVTVRCTMSSNPEVVPSSSGVSSSGSRGSCSCCITAGAVSATITSADASVNG
jgi:hypothetical protein